MLLRLTYSSLLLNAMDHRLWWWPACSAVGWPMEPSKQIVQRLFINLCRCLIGGGLLLYLQPFTSTDDDD